MQKILIVDDEQPIRTLLDYNLKQSNFETIMAADGEEAILKVENENPDLILLDLMLPKMDGIEVCKTSKAEEYQHAYHHADSKRRGDRQSIRIGNRGGRLYDETVQSA